MGSCFVRGQDNDMRLINQSSSSEDKWETSVFENYYSCMKLLNLVAFNARIFYSIMWIQGGSHQVNILNDGTSRMISQMNDSQQKDTILITDALFNMVVGNESFFIADGSKISFIRSYVFRISW